MFKMLSLIFLVYLLYRVVLKPNTIKASEETEYIVEPDDEAYTDYEEIEE